MILHQYLAESARRLPDKTAVITETGSIDYSSLLTCSARLAAAARTAGLERGGRVVLFTDNSVGYVASYFGTLMAGGVVVGQSTANKEGHLRNIIQHSEAVGVVTSGRSLSTVKRIVADCPSLRFLFYDGFFQEIGRPDGLIAREFQEIFTGEGDDLSIPSVEPQDLAQIIYTSGTTGNPKGVMLSHGNLCANTNSIIQYIGLTEKDRVMVVMPFYYSYGNSLMLSHVACGGSIVIDNRFAYPHKIIERMNSEEVTGFSGVPSSFAILLNKAGLGEYEMPTLRYVTQAGGAMSPAVTKRLADALPDAKIFVMYGQTEASARLSYLEPDKLFDKLGSIGKAIPGVTLEVKNRDGVVVKPGEVGEIVARGANVMMGYWRNEDETRKVLKSDGLHTGDLATVDDEDYIYIVSRKSDMIKSGAHRISPKEIEEVIMGDGRVHEVAVTGEDDPLMGENIVAYVVAKQGAELDRKDILRLCGRHLPLYKLPKRVEFRDSLPKTTSGKIRKSLLKKETAHTK